jgi:hypothetical protein
MAENSRIAANIEATAAIYGAARTFPYRRPKRCFVMRFIGRRLRFRSHSYRSIIFQSSLGYDDKKFSPDKNQGKWQGANLIAQKEAVHPGSKTVTLKLRNPKSDRKVTTDGSKQ